MEEECLGVSRVTGRSRWTDIPTEIPRIFGERTDPLTPAYLEFQDDASVTKLALSFPSPAEISTRDLIDRSDGDEEKRVFSSSFLPF